MTPFPTDPDRTATISLNKQEEALVRREPDVNNLYEAMVVVGILKKLQRSLKVSDVLSGPVGHTVVKRERAPDIEINLDLLEL